MRSWFRETGSAVPSRVSLLNLFILRQKMVLDSWDSFRFPRTRLVILSTAIVLFPASSYHVIGYECRSLTRARRHRASTAFDSSSHGCSHDHGPVHKICRENIRRELEYLPRAKLARRLLRKYMYKYSVHSSLDTHPILLIDPNDFYLIFTVLLQYL